MNLEGTKILRKRPPAVAIVMGAFVASIFIIPTLAPVAIWDDWVYARVVENLVETGRLHIYDPVSPSLVFQALWGAAFSLVLGPSLGVLRLSTVVLFGLSGWCFYLLGRELGLDKGISALGCLLYLFSPLPFVLAFTFMTEIPLVALITIASLFYTRGLVTRGTRGSTILGGVFAGAAFLVRPHGLLVPVGAVLYVAFRRRLAFNRRSLVLLAEIGLAPLVIAVGYYGWILAGGGPTETQKLFAETIGRASLVKVGFSAWGTLIRSLLHVGIFLLPLLPAALIGFKRAFSAVPRIRLLALGMFVAMVCLELTTWWGSSFGYTLGLDTWLGPQGPGPPDLIAGGRDALVGQETIGVIGIFAALSGAMFLLVAMRPLDPDDVHDDGTRLMIWLGLMQLVGVFGLSLYWTDPFERYVVPLLPFVILIALRGLTRLGFRPASAWALAVCIAVFSVVGTRDFLVFERAIWKLADEANEMGVPDNRLLSSAARDSYKVWEEGVHRDHRAGYKAAWWVDIWDLRLEGRYIIVAAPQGGYLPMRRVEYSSWLHGDPQYLYLQKAKKPES